MDERRLEMKVGALVLAALVGVLGLLWLMGELRTGGVTVLSVDFAHTGNVVKGAPVKLGGVAVGRVEEIHLQPDRRDAQGRPLPVRMGVWVQPEVQAALRADTRVTVATVGPLGEPYLELNPGSASAPPLPSGVALRGTDAPRLDLVAQQLSAFLDVASGALADDPEGLRKLAANVSRLTTTMESVLNENRGDLRTLAGELSAAAKDLRTLARVSRETMQPGGAGARLLGDAADAAALVKRELPAISGTAAKTLNGLSAVTSELDTKDGERLKLALERYSAAGEKLDQIAGRADRLLQRIEAGEGTVGALQKDKQIYDDLRGLLSDLKKHPWKVLWKE
ncbi:MCE family protein [Archangium violaceum]|uniref:MlaD family protein n=1 Tax=Archangium violaceum TaxID=83451 RepID=UPI0019516896|nr:MlaD family protein [Archangium violaceum]QRN93033.1 MCE family protein [Archangium violaceum]